MNNSNGMVALQTALPEHDQYTKSLRQSEVNPMAKKDPAADKAAGTVETEAAARPDTLSVSLDRSYMWVRGDGTETSFGPGSADIPYAMAEGLVRAGRLDASVLPIPPAEQPAPTGAAYDDSDVKAALTDIKAELEALRALIEHAIAIPDKEADSGTDGS